MGYPSPGVFSLALAQGMQLVSAFDMGGADVFDFAFRKGEAPDDIKGLEGKTIVLGSAGWQSIVDPMLKAAGRRHHEGEIRRRRLADLGHGGRRRPGRCGARRGKACAPQWKGQGLDFDYILGRDFSKLPANSFVIRKADFEDPAKKAIYEKYLQGWAAGSRVRLPEPARRDADRHGAVPGPCLADDAGRGGGIDDAARQRLSRPLGRARQVGLAHHAVAGTCSSTPAARSARSPATSPPRKW